VLGALAGVLGSMMALEAIRDNSLRLRSQGLVGRLLMVEPRAAMRSRPCATGAIRPPAQRRRADDRGFERVFER